MFFFAPARWILPRAGAAPEGGAHRRDTTHLDDDRFGRSGWSAFTPWADECRSSPCGGRARLPVSVRRARMFWLDPKHPGALVPGKRPRTTLTPSLVTRDGAPYMVFGTPGGDQQDQWTLQFFLNVVEFGMDLQEAIDAPSFHTDHFPASFYPRWETALGSLTIPRVACLAETQRSSGAPGEMHKIRRGHGPWVQIMRFARPGLDPESGRIEQPASPATRWPTRSGLLIVSAADGFASAGSCVAGSVALPTGWSGHNTGRIASPELPRLITSLFGDQSRCNWRNVRTWPARRLLPTCGGLFYRCVRTALLRAIC